MYFNNCLQCDSINDENCEQLPGKSSEFHVTCVSTESNDSVATYHFKPYAFSKRGCYINYKGYKLDCVKIS